MELVADRRILVGAAFPAGVVAALCDALELSRVVGWLAGLLVGWEMALRPSNRRRNRWAVSLLDVQPADLLLEIGFGPGIAIREAARHAKRGHVVGIDHSPEMVRQATRRNQAAVTEGRVELRQAAVDALPPFDWIFDTFLAAAAAATLVAVGWLFAARRRVAVIS